MTLRAMNLFEVIWTLKVEYIGECTYRRAATMVIRSSRELHPCPQEWPTPYLFPPVYVLGHLHKETIKKRGLLRQTAIRRYAFIVGYVLRQRRRHRVLGFQIGG